MNDVQFELMGDTQPPVLRESPLVTVVVVADDDLTQTISSLDSLVNQTYSRVEYKFLFVGTTKSAVFENLVENRFPHASVLLALRRDAISSLNTIIRNCSGQFVTFIMSGDIYRKDRLETLVAEARQRHSGLLFSQARLTDYSGAAILSDQDVFRHYSHALLKNIEVLPSVSFLLLWDDVLLSSGNLFCGREIFEKVGGFREFAHLYAFDFLLRASQIEEPHLIRSNLITCRPSFLGRRLNISQDVEDERVEIISSHLRDILSVPPQNQNCDVFRSHPCMFAGVPWSRALADAIDGWVETRTKIEDPTKIHKSVTSDDLKGRRYKLLTHELSYSGAPVIVLEMASLFIDRGASVAVVSPVDGPLRKSFEQRKIPVSVLSAMPAKLSDQKARLVRYRAQNGPKWFFKSAKYHFARALYNARFYRARLSVRNTTGVMLINSVAAWQWVFKYLTKSDATIVWFVHETFDPKWMASAAADDLFRKCILAGRLKMIFGSAATELMWRLEGYPGRVTYWSGISEGKYSGCQLRAITPTKGKRVLLNVGSVGTRKGTRNLLEAFAYGRKHGLIADDVELRIVGSQKPSSKQETRDILFRAMQPDIRDSVRIVGILEPEAIESYYDEADIYVHSSFFDCMPIALLTAMARGMAIVATDVDGCPEAIIDGETGLLVPPRSPQQLAVAIGKLLAYEALREKVARGARMRFVELFSVEATFNPVRIVLDEKPLSERPNGDKTRWAKSDIIRQIPD